MRRNAGFSTSGLLLLRAIGLRSVLLLVVVLALAPPAHGHALLAADAPVQASASTLSGVKAIALGDRHSCALLNSGAVVCWGLNTSGQLGDGTKTNRRTPVGVSGLSSGVVAISAGYQHTCAVTAAGAAKCWGNNRTGQIGDGTDVERLLPTTVSGLASGVKAISAGYLHTCALTTNGTAKCWGSNSSEQLGNELNGGIVPTDVIGLSSGVQAIVAALEHTCALTSAGGVKCWGQNFDGQLGNGSTSTPRATPQDVQGLSSGVKAIAATSGGKHTCALTSGSGVKCWGVGKYGRLGTGAFLDFASSPVNVVGLSNGVSAIAAGELHTCAILATGAAQCWGADFFGQLGNGAAEYTNKPAPVNVVGLAGGALIGAGRGHTCALAAGAVQCWGNNEFGQVGDGTTELQRDVPVAVVGGGPSLPPAAYLPVVRDPH